MNLPVVAIVGRPNVGKSSLFNALVRSRVAIVDPTAGVTRDRVSMVLHVGDTSCELVDTGGIGIVDKAGLAEDIEIQIQIAMHQADVLLFLFDAQDGVMAPDSDIAARLRKLDKKVLLIANKADTTAIEDRSTEAFKLGFGEPIPVSATTGRGVGDLRDRLESELPETEEPDPDAAEPIRLAIVGRANAGKSTLVNRLVGRGRMIVSEVPGTTRDAVDLPFEYDGRSFIAVDTAGMRKRKAISGTPDFYGQARSERAVRRSDVVIFLIDAVEQIGRIERMLGDVIMESHKPCILVLSKWDLVAEGTKIEDYEKYLAERMPFFARVPKTVLSAIEDFHVGETLELAAELYEQAGQRMSTADLNRLVKAAMARKGPPVRGGRTGKIFFASQISVRPPTAVLFVNDSHLLTGDYRRYLAGFIRDHGEFPDVPVRLVVRDRDKAKGV